MEIQDVAEYCLDCPIMKKLEEDESTILNARHSCAHCRSLGKTGIYKADAIYTALKYKKRADAFNRAGKSPVIVKRYGKAVSELSNKGESLRSIARILGISVNSVRKCLKEYE